MKITFLGSGTSQGVPVIGCLCPVCQSNNKKDKRLRSSVLIESNNITIAIDSTPDFRQQMLVAKPNKLDAILFTHEHHDHIGGLDDIRAFNFSQNKDMPIYGTKRVIDRLKVIFDYAFTSGKYPGAPRVEPVEINANQPFKIQDLLIIPINAMHGNLPVLGYRIGDLTYLTDVNSVEDIALEKIKGSKVLIVSALHKKKHHSHFNLEQALAFIKLTGVEQGYLTHISHKMGLHKEVKKEIPANVFMAYDDLVIEL